MFIKISEIKLSAFWYHIVLAYINLLVYVELTSSEYFLHENSQVEIQIEENTQIWLLQNGGGEVEDETKKSLILGSNVRIWEIVLNLKIYEGEGDFYLYVSEEGRKKEGYLSKEDKNWLKEKQGKVKEYFKLKQGVNIITEENMRQIFAKENKSWNRNFIYSIIVFANKYTRFILEMGNLNKPISEIKMREKMKIKMEGNEIKPKIYKLNIDNNYILILRREKGFPNIKIYECMEQEYQCYNDPYYLTYEINSHQKSHIKYAIESMLVLEEEFWGTKCYKCELYISISERTGEVAELEFELLSETFIMDLEENEIFKSDLFNGGNKKYKVHFKQEKIRVSLQVYEGEVQVKAEQVGGSWKYVSGRSSGILKFEIPREASIKSESIFELTVIAFKDSTYSIVYSSGEYEIYIKDGYPTSHVLSISENITFIYDNLILKNSFIYVTLNVNDSRVIGQGLKVKVFVYNEGENEGQLLKEEFIGNERIEKEGKKHKINEVSHVVEKNKQYQHDKFKQETKAIVIELPGNVPKFEIFLSLSDPQTIEVTMTINDQEILFLPLSHSLPLQIGKDEHINLYVDNNEEGFLELVVKKCDESDPGIAYSLNPTDFMKEDFDYESLGEKGRIVRNVVKVGKGKGIYVRISGDGIVDSFVVVLAKYLHIDHIKLTKEREIKRGNNGEMNYQLITNSKVEIWFKELLCSKECRENVKYEFYLSNYRSDLFREMICPGIVVFRNDVKDVTTQSFFLNEKASSDGIIAFKQVLDYPIVYISVKAIYGSSNDAIEFIYENIEIVTFLGQVGRMSPQFLVALVLGGFGVCLGIIWIMKREGKLGYKKVRASERRGSMKDKEGKGGKRRPEKEEEISDREV